MENHIAKIFLLMQNGNEDDAMHSELLEHYYSNASPTEQEIIDTIMVCICGYSLDTIIYHPENIRK